jgi:hypothetical protein
MMMFPAIEQINYFACVFQLRYMLLFFASHLSAIMPLAFSIDRIFAVFVPLVHRSHASCVSYCLIFVSVTISAGYTLFIVWARFFTTQEVEDKLGIRGEIAVNNWDLLSFRFWYLVHPRCY